MTVYDLADLYIGTCENMQVWNFETEKTVFEGTFDEVKVSGYADSEVESFGIEDGIIVINIDEKKLQY